MKIILKTQIFLILLLNIISAVRNSNRRRSQSRILIQEFKGLNAIKYSDLKKKASECRFGEKRFELEETWHPDLGSPFGVMYCVHCQCVPIHKKRRILGRVRCKNIKSECPKPTCSNPVLLDERCCKICPGQDNNPDLNIQVDLKREEEEKNGRHYAALLSNSSSLTTTNSNSSATGRFYFRRKSLSYSFVTSPNFGWPKMLTFLDEEANIIEEFPFEVTPFQNYTRKICGSWSRVPRRYRRQLRRDQMYVQLTSDTTNDIIIGKIAKYFGLGSELFSSLLLSKNGGVGTGTAIISITPQVTGTGRVHTMLLISGLFVRSQIGKNNLPLQIAFQNSKDLNAEVFTHYIDVKLTANDIITIDFKTTFDSSMCEALGRGSMLLSIKSKSNPAKVISNYLVPRLSCDYFDTSLTPVDNKDEYTFDHYNYKEEKQIPKNSFSLPNITGRGVVWMYITHDGKITYKIKINRLVGQVKSIQIDNGRKSRRLLKIVADLLPNYKDGWANGTLSLPAEDIVHLYQEDLYVNVGTTNNKYDLRGRLFRHLKTDAQEDGIPILLMGNSTIITGVGWIHVDSTCTFNYEVRLSGQEISKKKKFHLYLVDFPLENMKSLSLFPEKRLKLEIFYGAEAIGHTSGLHQLTMARLNSGDAALVVLNDNSSVEITGNILHTRVPIECLPLHRRNELELIPGYLNDIGQERFDMVKVNTHCIYQEYSIYEDGDQWTALHESCSMCSCRRGKVICDPMVCPETDCDNPMILEGECCATCPTDVTSDNSLGCVFSGDKKFHIAGTRWHPYIPPFGFSRCAVCTCDAGTLQVKCRSQQCPKLNCLGNKQIRPNILSCCKICDHSTHEREISISDENTISIINNPEILKDMAIERTQNDILIEGGCVWRNNFYNNGDVWHPSVLPFGEMKCVNCKCKDGTTKCAKTICKKLSCLYQLLMKAKCCPRCATTKAEKILTIKKWTKKIIISRDFLKVLILKIYFKNITSPS
ncbi:dorsal-ventral patterning protein Sog isoform X3 [Lepeophtheirus salmonis]|uniref:dorsal-ventral patterning protein Sog isoform X3 n=1 Tax=Lepeophtheirus salmonis TaxID=72036 RepID=UPI003AF40AE7